MDPFATLLEGAKTLLGSGKPERLVCWKKNAPFSETRFALRYAWYGSARKR
jgi:hypothetical protein